MTNRAELLRERYENGWEIVVDGGPVNPLRADGYFPVLYLPRSRNDKSRWVRADGFPFRYHSGELKAVHTIASREYEACEHHSGCKHTTTWKRAGVAAIKHASELAAITDDRFQRPQRSDFSDAYDRAEDSLRAMDMLDEHWHQM